MATEMTMTEHTAWMVENNPEGWSSEQWVAFDRLMKADGAYARQVRSLNEERHRWAEEETRKEIGGRKVRGGVRLKIRRDYNRESRRRFPNPEPLAALESITPSASKPKPVSPGIAAVRALRQEGAA
jgi:hypothetical protein